MFLYEGPGFPIGVKLIHLTSNCWKIEKKKYGTGNGKPHLYIDVFIPLPISLWLLVQPKFKVSSIVILNKIVKELEMYDPKGIEQCMSLALKYSKQFFRIYQNKEDPYLFS